MIFNLTTILNFILPKRCLICGKQIKSSDSLCADCFANIHFITAPYCHHCGKPLSYKNASDNDLFCITCLNKNDIFRFRRSAIVYEEDSKKILLDFKFADHIENKKLLSKWLMLAGKDIFDEGVDLIIPVPLHYLRLIKRKYNQSAILAGELSKLCSVPACYDVLKKKKHTLPQVLCNGKERRTNIKNAFVVNKAEKIKGKRIVLIDDIYTTGATLKECAKVLIQADAKSVDALTVARV